MLPQWCKFFSRERIRIMLHPKHIVLMRLSKGFNTQVIEKKQVFCSGQYEMEGWSEVLSTLAEELAKPIWQNADVEVVISNHFVRYLLLPWNAELSNRAEQLAYLTHCYQTHYGQVANGWDVQLDTTRFNQASLASAMSADLIMLLHEMLNQNKLKLHSITPHLMIAINESIAQIGEAEAWLIVAEEGRVCVLSMADAKVKSVSSYAVASPLGNVLSQILHRESILLAKNTEDWRIWFYSPNCNGENNAEVLTINALLSKLPSSYWGQQTLGMTV